MTLTKGPFDQVAIFPSKVNKVNFRTQQITKEMQGLEVQAMIVWTIYREGDGPMKAFKYLGEDLITDEPVTANALITSQVQAIVRNRIANETMDEVIKNRDAIRSLIMDNLKPISKGWGIWIETVEVTEVKTLSASLFRDLQCKFREDQNRTATIQKMDVAHELNQQKCED